MHIVVLDGHTLNPGDNPWDETAQMGELAVYERTPEDQIVERSRQAEIVVTNKVPLTAQTIAALPRLRFIAVTATGYNIVDVEAARERGIPVSNVPEYGTDSVAQFVFAHLLEHCHHVAEHDAAVRAGRWSSCPDFCFWDTPLIELAGKTMGIVGFGRIGRRVGELAHAFGMSVLAHDVVRGAPPAYQPFTWAGSIADLFQRSDVVTLHCPQTAENVGFVDAQLLGQMKPGALLINTARGALVDLESLEQALSSGRLGGASLDVLPEEPPPAEFDLIRADRLLLTPHIAWATQAARKRLMKMTADNVRSFIAGHPRNVVN